MELECLVTWGNGLMQISCDKKDYKVLEALSGSSLFTHIEDINDNEVIIKTVPTDWSSHGQKIVHVRFVPDQEMVIECDSEKRVFSIEDIKRLLVLEKILNLHL